MNVLLVKICFFASSRFFPSNNKNFFAKCGSKKFFTCHLTLFIFRRIQQQIRHTNSTATMDTDTSDLENKTITQQTATDDNEDQDIPAPNPFLVLWPAYLCAFVDFMGAGIAIPILPYFVLELPWTTSGPTTFSSCPSCPQDPNLINATSTFRCGEVEGCGTSIEVGLSIAFFAFGQVIGNIVMSRLSDKLGRKLIIMISLAASALGYVWCGLATTITSLLLARATSGIAGGTLPVVQAMVLDTVGDMRERPKFFGLASACLGLGFMVGPGLGAAVNAITGSKRAAFFSPAVVASVALTVAFFKIKESKPGGGVFGPRDKLVDEIFDQGVLKFKQDMIKQARTRSLSGEAPISKPKGEPKLPTIVFYCAVAAAMGSFMITCMTSMIALVWLNLFNFGPTELGIFLTCIGFVSIFFNVVGVKYMISRFGANFTILLASILLCIGIVGFTFIDIFWIHATYFGLFIASGWSLTLPTLLSISAEGVPPSLRGKATGIIAGSMSFGFAICPLLSGPLFQANLLSIKHKYGTFSHSMFVFGGSIMGVAQLFVLIKGIVLPRNAAAKAKLKDRFERKRNAKVQN